MLLNSTTTKSVTRQYYLQDNPADCSTNLIKPLELSDPSCNISRINTCRRNIWSYALAIILYQDCSKAQCTSTVQSIEYGEQYVASQVTDLLAQSEY